MGEYLRDRAGIGVMDPELLMGMRHFLAVYEQHFEEITAGLVDATLTSPNGVAALRHMSREQFEEQIRVSHLLVRQAILEGQWGPLLERRNLQGQTYAELGIRFQEWFDIVDKFQALLTPHLVQAFATDPGGLTAALAGMNRYLNLGTREIARAYFDAVRRQGVR